MKFSTALACNVWLRCYCAGHQGINILILHNPTIASLASWILPKNIMWVCDHCDMVLLSNHCLWRKHLLSFFLTGTSAALEAINRVDSAFRISSGRGAASTLLVAHVFSSLYRYNYTCIYTVRDRHLLNTSLSSDVNANSGQTSLVSSLIQRAYIASQKAYRVWFSPGE